MIRVLASDIQEYYTNHSLPGREKSWKFILWYVIGQLPICYFLIKKKSCTYSFNCIELPYQVPEKSPWDFDQCWVDFLD